MIISTFLKRSFSDININNDFGGIGCGLFILSPLLGFGLPWGLVFSRYRDFIFDRERWLYKGLIGASVLELPIAVPSRVILQRRDQCSASMVSAHGGTTGIALLFMAFGPAIFLL